MFRYVILIVSIVQAATAGTIDFTSNTTWSFTSSGTNGPDFASASGSASPVLNFNVVLPAAAVVSAATLTLSQSGTINLPGLTNVSGCDIPGGQITGFVFQVGCSDIPSGPGPFPDTFYQDQIIIDAMGPGFLSALLNPNNPIVLDPSLIPVNGLYKVSGTSQASMVYTSRLDFNNRGLTPTLPSFSGSGTLGGTLEVQFTVLPTPEPAHSGWLAGIGLMALIGFSRCRRSALS